MFLLRKHEVRCRERIVKYMVFISVQCGSESLPNRLARIHGVVACVAISGTKKQKNVATSVAQMVV
jgi:hypothetical protein